MKANDAMPKEDSSLITNNLAFCVFLDMSQTFRTTLIKSGMKRDQQ